uniref:G_PROTEIN_RECEP_F1_2 domain-containing protein n=1 Tax=Caenorhabditis tropicalis TaxID=1561998 RepID=A0A1I7UBW6_9PELO
MAAVALADILSLLSPIEKKLIVIYYQYQECPIGKYWIAFLGNTFDGLLLSSRRFSVWLSVSIAVIRTLVVRNPLSPTFGELSKPKALLYCILAVIPLCIPISIIEWLKYSIEPSPFSDCNGNETDYMTVYSALFTDNDYLVFRFLTLWNPPSHRFVRFLIASIK